MKKIRSEAAYNRTLSRINELMDADPGSIEGVELVALTAAVEDYEEKHETKHFPLEKPNVGTWNYRIMKTHHENGLVSYGIHEVYYAEDGKPTQHTEEPCYPYGETTTELAADATNFISAFNHPILEFKDGKYRKSRASTRLEVILEVIDK